MLYFFRWFSSLMALVMGSAAISHAVVIDFEKPGYVPGNLAGQGGWRQAEGNPTAATILGPQGGSISGSQSASIIGAAGAARGRMVSAFVNEAAGFEGDGTPAPDINVSFLFRKTQIAGFGGLSIRSRGMRSGIAGVRVNGNRIEALQEGGTYVRLGTYNTADIVEFSLDIDLDTNAYKIYMRNVTSDDDGFTLLTEPALTLETSLQEGELAISISGQRGQTIFDDLALTPNARGASSFK